ncbi:AGAP002702-PA-like protein [Anopheles sinensis]|uniref:AGAP002702-PA-like protein n=1 Tax=Anopheles sinensis TaxID=74873 RepID=A0A084VB69_ANOSI|nr:AGAP002702-PA-like protein [Anopheles sinensis]
MHYPSYIHPGYDPGSYYAGGPGSGLDYGSSVLGAPLQPTDYKSTSSVVSSARYHPYGGGGSSGSSNGGTGNPDGSSPALVSSNGGGGSAGLSPHVVSSSNNGVTTVTGSGSTATSGASATTVAASTTSAASHSPQNGGSSGGNIPPTPSPSPIQCEKCGLVCESDEVLHEHENTVHGSGQASVQPPAGIQEQRVDQVELQAGGNCYPYGGNGGAGTPQYPKEEPPASDILDLDSQKMVYTPTADGGASLLPPMNSLHPLQSMQRHHPMMAWPHHDPHNFMGPPPLPPHPHGGPEMKHSAAAAAAAAAAYYHHPIKSEYSATPSIKSEYLGGGGVGGGLGQYGSTGGPGLGVKNEYSLAPTLPPPAVAPQPTNTQSMKQYADEMHDNQLATSPSDFPSTTTPQESGSQYRTFEPATSSLPGPPGPTKGTAWKSNEARRPKTYNCTACNKWFTSSGHLKRHYNTTLHKNAVKSSGQPDPATLPISVHHHPGRDPNYANKGRRGGANGGSAGANSQLQQPIQQPVPPPDPPRSPEYGAQQQQQQQYGMGASAGFPGAGASAQVVSSNQGLQIYSNNNSSNSSSNSHNMALEQTEQPTHPTITITLPPIITSTVDTQGTIYTPSTLTIPTDHHTRTHHTTATQPPQQQQPPPQPQPPPPTISSMEPYHHHHHHPTTMHTISNPLTISTSIPSFQTILPEAPSYHLIIDMLSMTTNNGQQQQQQQWAVGDGLLIESPVTTTAGGRGLGSLGFPRCSGGAEMYQGDTAPPFSPNVPDQYQRPSSSQGVIMTILDDQQHQQHHQMTSSTTPNEYHDYGNPQGYSGQLLQRVATPQLAAIAPSISPAPCSPSVTSTEVGTAQPQHPNGPLHGLIPRPKPRVRVTPKAGSEPEIHRCIECDKVFNKVCYLTQHNKTFHSGDKPYKCHRCGKRFACSQSYEEHLAKHGGEKPFKCEQCPKQFNHKTDLRRHMCLHSGSKPYACEQCGKGFIRKDHMMKHAETHRKSAAAASERAHQRAAGKMAVGRLKGKRRASNADADEEEDDDGGAMMDE